MKKVILTFLVFLLAACGNVKQKENTTNPTVAPTTTEFIPSGPLYTKEDNYIYFGTYPQTEVTDTTLINELIVLSGTFPTATDSKMWESYKYYMNEHNTTDYMWYKDIRHNNIQYRGVYFTSYRPFQTGSNGEIANSYQDDNGYIISNVYWFKYEPIKWKILNETNNEALLLCEMVIDSQPFQNTSRFVPLENKYYNYIEQGSSAFANNWEYSTIRSWLNDTFYKTAFYSLQKEIIISQSIDNKTTAYYSSTNEYALCQKETEDSIY